MIYFILSQDPSNYKILNGFSKENDPLMKVGIKDPRYPEAYYPRYDPALHPKQYTKASMPYQKRPQIYGKDTRAYYGPATRYQVINTSANEGKATRVILKDLSELSPTKEKINELQKQLNNLNNYIYLPKNMMKSDKGRLPYYSDLNAYYDPTRSEKMNQKRALEQKINRMKVNLRTIEMEKRAAVAGIKNPFEAKKVQGRLFVENRNNVKTEVYNDFISKNMADDDNNKKTNTITPPVKTSGPITFSTIASNYETSNNSNPKIELKNGKFLF